MRFVLFALPLAALTFGCSDPVPPTPQGAWSVSFAPIAGESSKCTISQHNTKVGDINDHERNGVVINGTDNASVDCSVVPSGSGFHVEAQETQNSNNLLVSVDGLSASSTQMAPAKGKVAYSSLKTAYAFSNPADTPCEFYVIPKSGEGVGAGKVWAAFTCPKLDGEMSECTISVGYFIFENCASQ
jgi:hypothetical protein